MIGYAVDPPLVFGIIYSIGTDTTNFERTVENIYMKVLMKIFSVQLKSKMIG